MTHARFLTKMFNLQVNSHILHLRSKSYSEHMALDGLYKELVNLIDRYAESAQSEDLIAGYGNITIEQDSDPKKMLASACKEITVHRNSLTEGYLQQICDDFCELINSTLYKLKFLK